MKKQNASFALLMLFLSIACLFVGYWLGLEEKNEVVQMHVKHLADAQERYVFDATINLKMLNALQSGNSDVVIKILTNRVKSALQPIPLTGHKEIDELAKLSTPRKETYEIASEYQSTYCEDKCLGL